MMNKEDESNQELAKRKYDKFIYGIRHLINHNPVIALQYITFRDIVESDQEAESFYHRLIKIKPDELYQNFNYL